MAQRSENFYRQLTLVSKSAKFAKSAKPPLFVFAVLLSPQPPVKGSPGPGFVFVFAFVFNVLVGLLLELSWGGGGFAGLVFGGAGLGGGCLDFLGGRAGVGLSGLGGGPPPPPVPPALKGSLPKGSLAPCKKYFN